MRIQLKHHFKKTLLDILSYIITILLISYISFPISKTCRELCWILIVCFLVGLKKKRRLNQSCKVISGSHLGPGMGWVSSRPRNPLSVVTKTIGETFGWVEPCHPRHISLILTLSASSPSRWAKVKTWNASGCVHPLIGSERIDRWLCYGRSISGAQQSEVKEPGLLSTFSPSCICTQVSSGSVYYDWMFRRECSHLSLSMRQQ